MPGSVYAGNRFRMLPRPYPCLFDDPGDFRPDVPNTISDVPRLRLEPGPSRIQQQAGDLSVPAVGLFHPARWGLWMTADPVSSLGQTLFEVSENSARDEAWLRAMTPAVREDQRFSGGPGWVESQDLGACFRAGDEVRLRFHLEQFACESIPELWSRFYEVRSRFGSRQRVDLLPFSEAFRLVEAKYNLINWDEEAGYYACGDRVEPYAHWQMGWVGGGMSAYAMAAEGRPESIERAYRNFDWIAQSGVAPAGVFWSFAQGAEVFGDMIDMTYGPDWHLVRRSGDGLYFLCKLYSLAKACGESSARLARWQGCLERVADALAGIWKRFGQFGQFVSDRNGAVIVGGTASGGIIPGALALASSLFDRPDWLAVSQESASTMVERFVDRGFTTGGPGEALQCPDSESAFGLLESLVVLHEVTGDSAWLAPAKAAADLACSWVMSWDFPFPAESCLGQIGAHSTGTVWANSQNKHAAPGICTLSGSSLFRLFRATGERRYLEILSEIAHSIPQFVSRAEQPIYGMGEGFICERVNTCDWEAPRIGVGEGFDVGCWCEVSMLLTYAETPGVYVDLDSGWTLALDHVEAVYENGLLKLSNPTDFAATVSVVADSARKPCSTPLRFTLESHGSATFKWV
ncbi:MAG TPA: hypothetical protein VG944_02285 [Fimbriimonas sp.]|nr:hypothetical protein [Fimbriimonas sp.]